ncbi:hypothetical protein BDV95DRAFT_661363 [Massariosphaeria phaeospora]|uniref:Uncharacterized protein n=1 Tax=Massariosphaeria phaeospora TaxID=100035 RepID=A0A7C8I6X2_9PLEO|nr:hypothetical protein BDV95DRAFT_661363 [Massariosphaeria phaeospora]
MASTPIIPNTASKRAASASASPAHPGEADASGDDPNYDELEDDEATNGLFVTDDETNDDANVTNPAPAAHPLSLIALNHGTERVLATALAAEVLKNEALTNEIAQLKAQLALTTTAATTTARRGRKRTPANPLRPDGVISGRVTKGKASGGKGPEATAGKFRAAAVPTGCPREYGTPPGRCHRKGCNKLHPDQFARYQAMEGKFGHVVDALLK